MNLPAEAELSEWGPFGRPLFNDASSRALSRVGVIDIGSNSVRLYNKPNSPSFKARWEPESLPTRSSGHRFHCMAGAKAQAVIPFISIRRRAAISSSRQGGALAETDGHIRAGIVFGQESRQWFDRLGITPHTYAAYDADKRPAL